MQEAVTSIISQMRFPQKLWYLLDMRTDAILWGGTGRTILLNYRILHSYLQCDHSIFKTTNISSFIRQLNLYGFRKVTSHLQDPLCNSSNPYMHEYIHDYFQYGRPELLNKITRKALTIKRNFKTKLLDRSEQQLLYVSPLQKARRALRVALKNAAQDLLVLNNSPKQTIEFDDAPEEFVDDEQNIELDWFINKNEGPKESSITPNPEPDTGKSVSGNGDSQYRDCTPRNNLMDFSDEACQQNTENFQTHFLSMPDLNAESNVQDSDVELLAEFNIDNVTDGDVAKKKCYKDTDCNLNCVLPSVGNDQIYDVSIMKNDDESNHYNSEWDQMFNDIMSNKNSSQENASNFRELYSQISQTIDLLNS